MKSRGVLQRCHRLDAAEAVVGIERTVSKLDALKIADIAIAPASVLAAAPDTDWASVDPHDLLVIDLAGGQRVVADPGEQGRVAAEERERHAGVGGRAAGRGQLARRGHLLVRPGHARDRLDEVERAQPGEQRGRGGCRASASAR